MSKSAQDPRAFSDVVDYLHGLGFDHLYLRSPSSRAEPGRDARRPAARPSPAGPPPARSSAAAAGKGRLEPARPGVAPAPAAASIVPPPSSPEERFARYDELERRAKACQACRLAQGRRHVVFGSGKIGSDLMFIGEGPGAEEDRQGLPFVGAAGALLTRIIEAIDLRREDVYIANMVKCRPPGNRDPEADEVSACRPFLDEQIDLVGPKLIVVLGRVAAQALLETSAPLGRLRDQWHQVRGVPARATYHPAALLRYQKFKRPTWEDMKAVRDRLRQLRG